MNPTVALVLETNNLGGGDAGLAQVADSLGRLLRHLRAQTHPLDQLDALVVTHHGLSERHQAELEEAAGRSIRFIELPKGTGYYEAKNLGFEATASDLVVFGDSDCWPEPGWLENLVTPLVTDTAGLYGAVAGRTTYRGDLQGIAATTVDFAYFRSPLGDDCTRNFYANNVVFRRAVFEAYRYRKMEGVYRGHCQVMALHLNDGGVRVLFEPRARTTHRFPDSARELFQLRLFRGQDAAIALPHFADALLPRWLHRVGRIKLCALVSLALRCVHSIGQLNRQDMPRVRGLRRIACLLGIVGIYSADSLGVLKAALGFSRSSDAVSLSYHRDVDSLA